MRLMGLGSKSLRRLATDGAHRVRTDLLEAAIEADRAAGMQPFCVIGNAGATNTGAVDPLDALADIAERHGLWFHIDGAYGALAALAPETHDELGAFSRADSLVVDPHKWLNIPYDAGCILVRSWSHLSDAFSLVPEYLRVGNEAGLHDHWQHGFELTRCDRALKVWLAIRQYGVNRLRAMIEDHLALTRRVAEWVRNAPDFEMVSPPCLSVCCFRYAPPGMTDEAALNQLNHDIESELTYDGRALITGTELDGLRVLRSCIVNHRATWEGVQRTLEIAREVGERVLARPA